MQSMKLKAAALVAMLLVCQQMAIAATVSINIKYPGGNVIVGQKDGSTIHLTQDNRDSLDWFYWNFEATADDAGEVKFVFPAKKIGPQGPSYSTDGGKTWQWLGPKDASDSEFVYTFEKAGQTVRFSSVVPYLLADFNAFLDKQKNNPLLKQSTLTRTRQGKDVPLLQIGESGEGKTAVLLTARHHACESMASYALEGFMTELLSDSYSSKQFLSKHVVYVVPFVDLDGVQAGDQGKNRRPHDHNRDYIPEQLYPETAAIMKLADEKHFVHAMDFHCPTLRSSNFIFYYDGPKFPHTASNIDELKVWQGEEGPLGFRRPGNFMKAITPNRTPMNSDFFGYRDEVINAATIEVPYNLPGTQLTPDLIREFGSALLKSWMHTQFSRDAEVDRGINSYGSFKTFRDDLTRTRGDMERIKTVAETYAGKAEVPVIYQIEIEVHKALALQKANDEAGAKALAMKVLENSAATATQKRMVAELVR